MPRLRQRNKRASALASYVGQNLRLATRLRTSPLLLLTARQVRGEEYLRTVHLIAGVQRHVYGWVRVGHRPQKNVLTVTVSAALLPMLSQVLARVRHLFDLYCDPDRVYEILVSMNNIHPGLFVPGTRLPGSFDSFEMAVRAVLGQQITVKGARTLAARLVETYGVPIQTGIEGLTHAFPSPKDIIALDGPIGNHLGPLGISGTRATTTGHQYHQIQRHWT